MKRQCSLRIYLFSVVLFIANVLFSQTFDYTHWSGGKYRATIITSGGRIQFYHTHLSNTGWIHVSTSANIDYKTDDGRDYTATLRYDVATGRFVFYHCSRGGGCHEDVIIRVRDGNNGQWEISIKPQSGEEFGKTAVTLEKKVLREPDQEPPSPPSPPPPTQPCQGNGVINFHNTYSQSLWLFYWYAEDVANGSEECKVRKLWKQLVNGNNSYQIPKNKTMIYRIYTKNVGNDDCSSTYIKQYGSAYSCQWNNGIVSVN